MQPDPVAGPGGDRVIPPAMPYMIQFLMLLLLTALVSCALT
ncbi:MAG TPA: hypothetical protein VE684_18800 [Crenalkalicoccus sp.]|nr:hypothetical protein [Crenalkalicoccus sp.]